MQGADRVHLFHQGVGLLVPYFFLGCELLVFLFDLIAQQLVRPDETVVGFLQQLEQVFGCWVSLPYRTGLGASVGERSSARRAAGSPI